MNQKDNHQLIKKYLKIQGNINKLKYMIGIFINI